MISRIIAQINTLNESITYWEKRFSGESSIEERTHMVNQLTTLYFAKTTLQNLLDDSFWNEGQVTYTQPIQ